MGSFYFLAHPNISNIKTILWGYVFSNTRAPNAFYRDSLGDGDGFILGLGMVFGLMSFGPIDLAKSQVTACFYLEYFWSSLTGFSGFGS